MHGKCAVVKFVIKFTNDICNILRYFLFSIPDVFDLFRLFIKFVVLLMKAEF